MLTTLVLSLATAAEPRWDQLTTSTGWESVATKSSDFGAVAVYHKKIDGIDCLTGVLNTDAKAETLMAVVHDVPSSLQWSSADLVYSETLGRSSGAIQFWQYINIPNWTLVADRFWVGEGRTSTVGESQKFRWNRLDATGAYPALVEKARATDSGAVEPPTNWGEWTFTPVNGQTEVIYRACADVGGRIPESVQRWIATQTLPDTIADLVREARRRG